MAAPSNVVTRSSIRTKAARNLHKLNILDRLLWLRGRTGVTILTVLTYHRIGDPSIVGELDPDVRESDGQGLAEQIDVIRRVGTIVSLADVQRFFLGERLPPNPVLLAFDDGYIECRRDVFPLLQQLGVPGVFFIPTAYPDSGRLFWWDKIALIVERCRLSEIVLHYPYSLRIDLRSGTKMARRTLLQLVKRTAFLDLSRFFEELLEAARVTFDSDEEQQLARKTIMSFQDIRELDRAGMAIASHAHTHRVLATLSPDDALLDMRKSRMILEDVLEKDVRTIAYPVGHRVSGAHLRATKLAGFDLGFTNATGLCWSGATDPLNVPRMAIGQDEPAEICQWRMLVG